VIIKTIIVLLKQTDGSPLALKRNCTRKGDDLEPKSYTFFFLYMFNFIGFFISVI
jgi:hypothetical protein